MFEKQLKSPLRSPLLRAILAGNSTQYMIEGYNLATNNSYTGAPLFANVCYQMDKFERFSGVGAWTQDQGTVAAVVGTDEFRAKIVESPASLPAGTYTVYNPTGANISFGIYANPTTYTGGYSTATSFTFTYPGSGMLALFVKGSLTCTGSSDALKVILPGHTASWAAGNVWNADYLTFRAGLGGSVLRTMDWTQASWSIETDWVDRTTATKVSLFSNIVGLQVIPYELCIDLANRTGADPWICLPHRATSDYVTQFGTLVASTLSPSRRLWLEHGNEIWNYGSAWAGGTWWVDFLNFTKYTATANYGTDTYTLNSHGLINGNVIRAFTTKENNVAFNSAGGTAVTYEASRGVDCVVYAATANTFRLYKSDGVTANPVASSQVNLVYCKAVEAVKSQAINSNYGDLCIRNWDILDSIIGVNSYNRLVVRQAANTTSLTGALAVSGVSTRATYISCAPYIYSFYWAGKIAISSGTFTPSVWVSTAKTMHVSVYADGATPSDADIIAGTGAINHQTVSASTGAGSWQAVTAVTGLSNGTSYKVYFLVVDTKKNWVSSQTLVASATASNAFFYDTNANQAERDRAGSDTTSLAYATAFMAAGSGVPMFCYEGGYHNAPDSGITEVVSWLTGTYQESTEFASVILDNLYRLASIGVKGHCYYSEMTGTTNVFSIADSVTDTADLRYAALAALGGRVAVQPVLSVSNTTPAAIPSLPSLPYTIETLPTETDRTYAIVGGNQSGNYDLSGNNLRLTAATGIDWGTPVSNVVYLEAFRGALSDQFTSTFTTGSAWYEGDSNFAWSTIVDTDTASVNPTIGSAIAGTGTAAVAAGGLWTMQTDTKYTGSSAISTTPASGTPFLFAFVMDKNTQGTSYVTLVSIGTGAAYIKFAMDGTYLTLNTWFGTTLATNIQTIATVPTGAHVHWMYSDGGSSPTYCIGRDQTDITTLAPPAASGKTLDATRTIGHGSGVVTKMGSMQTVSRAGMTLADAKSIVAKMQAHHGIA